MCASIFINNTDIQLCSVEDFETHYKVDSEKYKYDYYDTIEKDACMCQIDLEQFFKDNPQLNGKYDCGEWFADK